MMIGVGTLTNVAAIILGGLAGLLLGGRLRPATQDTVLHVTGLAVVVLGLAGALADLLTVHDGHLEMDGTLMMVVCLALGGLIGEALGLQRGLDSLGEWLRRRSGSEGDTGFVPAFVTASATVGIGAMAVVGGIEDGLGDPSVLIAKAVIDGIIICVMSAALGRGCVFSALPVCVFQGVFTLLGLVAGDVLPAPALANLSLVGNVLITGVGLNIVRERQLRVVNLLPALALAVAWGCF